MIVVGIDPHMKTHTAVAVDAVTGVSIAEKTVTCDGGGHDELLAWARGLDTERRFAIEDCRHVSGRLERHLLPHGERVVRVPPKMMAGARSAARTYGKSDPIDAACVARAALREPGLPEASLTGPEHDVRLLVDHRDDLVDERKRIQKRLRWNCHDLEIALDLPPRVLDRYVWLDRLEDVLERSAGEHTPAHRTRSAEAMPRTHDRDPLARTRDPHPDARTRPGPAGDPGLLGHQRCASHRPDGRRLPVQRGGGLRDARRDGAAAGLLGQVDAPSAQPLRQPPPQLDHPHDRRHPGSDAPSGDRLHGAQAGRGDELPRGAALPEATLGESGVQDDAEGGT